MNHKDENCDHPVRSRTDLSKGGGFHCVDCGASIKIIPLGEPKASSQTQPSCVSPHYKVLPVDDKKKDRWMIYDTLGRKPVKVDGMEALDKKKAVRICDEKNGTTVDNISPSNDDDIRRRAKKEREQQQKAKQELATRARREWLHGIEAEAIALREEIGELHSIGQNMEALKVAFKDKLEAIKPRCKAVLRGFAHLRKGEDIQGYRTATEWCKNTFGVTYEWMRRCLNPPKDSTPTFKDLRITKFLPSPDPTETKIQAAAVVAPLPKVPEASEGGERLPSVIESLANTNPPYAIGVSSADIATNSAQVNASLILKCAQYFRKFMTAGEWRETARLVMQHLQFELGDEGGTAQQEPLPPKPVTEGESAAV